MLVVPLAPVAEVVCIGVLTCTQVSTRNYTRLSLCGMRWESHALQVVSSSRARNLYLDQSPPSNQQGLMWQSRDLRKLKARNQARVQRLQQRKQVPLMLPTV